jgi:cyclopropane-fatty-acyl-phospholipid synthase
MLMLQGLLARFARVGDLTVTFANGRTMRSGDGSGAPVRARLTRRGERRIALNPHLGLGEAYMDGDLELQEGSFWDLCEIIGRNAGPPHMPNILERLLRSLERTLEQWNSRGAATRRVRHHYDLSLELYRRFLDQDLQYSCAYFTRPDMTLEEAQAAKKAHLAAKLLLQPGQRVLDIGCGWGGLDLDLAERHGVSTLGVTLSPEQLATARFRAQARGLAFRSSFELKDYRDVEGRFDRIVSVGMLEHVGAPYLGAYFKQVERLLADDGVAVIHAIGGRTPPGLTQPFIRKYIFPGGYIPSLSEVTKAIEDAGLWITDIEVLRLHYAETLRAWRERFMARRGEVAELYDERFCRMWEVYLGFSEMAFRYLNNMVFQVQLTKQRTATPLTRDYMVERERQDLGEAAA